MDFYKGKNCIVTGGAGFIGKNIAEKLIENGANVYVVDNFSYGTSIYDVSQKAKIIEGDVKNKSTFTKLPKIKYNYLFHFAAPSSIILFKRNVCECTEITTVGFLNALDFSVKNKIEFIYPSSGSLYSGASLPNSEKNELKLNELNSYANNKLALENIARIFEKSIRILGLRIFAGYGPSEQNKGEFASVVYFFCKEMFNGKSPEIWGDGTQERDFVYVDDIADIVLCLAENCKERVINIGSGESISFNRVVKEINKILPKKIEPIYVSKPNLYLEKTLSDNTLLRKYYKNKLTPIEFGVKEIINSFIKK